MKVYRITRKKYADRLSGVGASLSTINRWNSKGTEMIYTAESEALARAELAGHINLGMLPDPVLLEIELASEVFYKPVLPENWDITPPSSGSKLTGDEFIGGGNDLVMQVPSKYDRQQSNFLINPHHPDFNKKVKVVRVVPLK